MYLTGEAVPEHGGAVRERHRHERPHRPPPRRRGDLPSSPIPRKALLGGISKVNSLQVCHLLATLPLKVAPKPSPNPKTVPWDTPRRAFCGVEHPDEGQEPPAARCDS